MKQMFAEQVKPRIEALRAEPSVFDVRVLRSFGLAESAADQALDGPRSALPRRQARLPRALPRDPGQAHRQGRRTGTPPARCSTPRRPRFAAGSARTSSRRVRRWRRWWGRRCGAPSATLATAESCTARARGADDHGGGRLVRVLRPRLRDLHEPGQDGDAGRRARRSCASTAPSANPAPVRWPRARGHAQGRPMRSPSRASQARAAAPRKSPWGSSSWGSPPRPDGGPAAPLAGPAAANPADRRDGRPRPAPPHALRPPRGGRRAASGGDVPCAASGPVR